MKSIDSMLTCVDKLIRDYDMLPRGTGVVCAVSGGADSLCLLHYLYRKSAQLDIRVYAAHYNHCLRGAESQRDEEFVRRFVAEHCGGGEDLAPVKLFVERGDVARIAKAAGRGLEETGRELRYAFLRRTAAAVGARTIATGHNQGDNAETFLLHLMRGAGLRGLTGIPPVRGGIVRPLLTTRREEIEAYLARHGLPFVNDSTNFQDVYTRNRIRHQLIPQLEQLSPGFASRLEQTMESLRLDEQCLERQAEKLLEDAGPVPGGVAVCAKAIAQAHDAVAVRAARLLLSRVRCGDNNCTAAHLRGIVALCRGADPSARMDLPEGLTARREYEMLLLTFARPQPLTERVGLRLPGVTPAGGYLLECEEAVYRGQRQGEMEFFLSQRLCPTIALRPRRTGDYLRRPGRPGKLVKKLMIDEKIPLSSRDELPVLEVIDRVAAVAGLGPDCAFLPTEGEKAWQIKIVAQNKRGR